MGIETHFSLKLSEISDVHERLLNCLGSFSLNTMIITAYNKLAEVF